MPAAADVSVDSVVEALVREHLINKGFTSTLAAWQQEQPALQHPINKRSVLHDVLGLTAAQPAPPRQKPSTLDLLVQQHLLRKQSAAAPDAPPSSSSSKTHPSTAGCLTDVSISSQATKQQPLPVSESSTQQQQQQQQQEQAWHRRLPAMAQQHVAAQTPHRPLGSRPLGARLQPPSTSRAGAASTSAHESAAATQQLEELVVCDVDFDDADTATAAVASTSTATAGSAGRVLQDFQPLPPEQQRQLAQLVWGEPGVRPEAAWQQGLIWNDAPGLEWGLLQLSGGPCGVLAAVQAHLIATLMEQHLWHPSNPAAPASSSSSRGGGSSGSAVAYGGSAQPTAEQLQAALASSLVLLLWNCATTCSSGSGRSGPAAHVVVLQQSAAGSAGLRGLCDVGQVLRMVQVATAHSMEELEVLVRAALPQWCARKGWGLLLLVYSALLSRGCQGVGSDMDNEVRLVDSLGYCSMELVNLLLTGAAVSNVFDGCQSFGDTAAPAAAGGEGGQLVIKGVQQRGRVGLLTLFEWYRYVEVGQNLKCPRLPVWVVCSESHFSVLALSHVAGVQQTAPALLEPSAGQPLLLHYYDGLSKQVGPIVLELRPARAGLGWSSRMEGVAEERGVWQGRPIPPLECVLETKWRDVAVTWHGSEPIL